MSNSAPFYNLHNSNQLIKNEQNYVLDRKLLTIHSEDRDIKKWPNANHFEIMLPESMLNVQSMRLVQIMLPANYYTFSKKLQNTKFSFDASGCSETIEIAKGFYSPSQIAAEVQNKMNDAMGVCLDNSGYNAFQVAYNCVSQNIWIGNEVNDFSLNFGTQMIYDFSGCPEPLIWDRYTKWGMPFNLGYERKRYGTISDISDVTFDYTVPKTLFLDSSDNTNTVYYAEAPTCVKILGEKAIYMEVDKYNSYDELYPYSQETSSFYNNDYGGKVKSAFAKIPITIYPLGELFDSRNGFLQNLSHYDPPIERIAKLKFKFRYHDGTLVDFQKFPFTFVVEFNQLKNEINKKYNVRIPCTYRL
jgi:hypothetical protein